MKLQTQKQRTAREASLRAMAQSLNNLADSREKNTMELVWFVTKEEKNYGTPKIKIVPTGGSNKMAFRRNQLGIRRFWRGDYEGHTVHVIDLLSGMKSTMPMADAMKLSQKSLREQMIANIIGLNTIYTY